MHELTATDELRRMLDERGVEWTVPDESWNQDSITYWKVGSIKWVAFESENDTLWLNCNSVTDLTPAQAIAATLGDAPCPPYWWTHDGTLHIELPKLPESISVRLPDERDRDVSDVCHFWHGEPTKVEPDGFCAWGERKEVDG